MTDYAATYNLGGGELEDKAKDLRRLNDAGALIVGLQEGSDRRALRRHLPHGWASYWPALRPGAKAVPILWNAELLRRVRFASLLAVAAAWVGAVGAGPTHAKAKRLTLVVLEDRQTGERWRVVNTHFLPSAGRRDLPNKEAAARRWHYVRHAQALGRLIDRLRGRRGHRQVIVTLDANAERDFPLLAPVRAAGLGGWTTRPTEGHRAIDHVLGLDGDRVLLDLSSDHRAVLAPLSGSEPPTMPDPQGAPREFYGVGYLPPPPRPTITKALTAAAVGFAGTVGEACLSGALELADVTIAAGVGLLAGVATYRAPYFARRRDDAGEVESPEGRHRGRG